MTKEQPINKRGPWSKDDKQFISENCDNMDYKEMSAILGRDAAQVKRYIQNVLGKKAIVGASAATGQSIYDIKTTQVWRDLKQEFSDDELITFMFHWNRIVKQFSDDVLPTEELQIIDMIKIELLMGRSLKQQRSSGKLIEEWAKEIEEMKQLDVELRDLNRLESLESNIGFHRGALQALTKEYNELLNRKGSLMKDLKGTRAERIKRIEDSKQTLIGWVTEILQNKRLRIDLGDYMEKMRVAIDIEKVRLMEPHKYMDGTIDCPLLTTETLSYLDNKDKQEEK